MYIWKISNQIFFHSRVEGEKWGGGLTRSLANEKDGLCLLIECIVLVSFQLSGWPREVTNAWTDGWADRQTDSPYMLQEFFPSGAAVLLAKQLPLRITRARQGY